jgi:hypothetical protein
MVKEGDIKDICPYCSREVGKRKWESDFEVTTQYETVKCDCGKKLSVKCDFITSGDNWEDEINVKNDQAAKIIEDAKGVVKERKATVHTLEKKMKVVAEYEWKFEKDGRS